MTSGSTIGSTDISLNKITSTQEYETLLTQNADSSLTTNSTRLLGTRPWSGSTNVELDGATPHAMSEFIGYKAPLNSSDYTVASTDTTVTANMSRNSSSNFVTVGQQFRVNLGIVSMGGTSYRLTASVQKTGSPVSGSITYNNLVGSSTGTGNFYVSNQTLTKTMFTVDLNYNDFPDSYRWVESGAWSGSAGLIQRTYSYTVGNATYANNPPSTTYTFSGGSGPGTTNFPAAYATNVTTQDECSSFSTTLTTSLQLVFRKSGYADTAIGPACTVISNNNGTWTAGTCLQDKL